MLVILAASDSQAAVCRSRCRLKHIVVYRLLCVVSSIGCSVLFVGHTVEEVLLRKLHVSHDLTLCQTSNLV